jgi:hypothetical protein
MLIRRRFGERPIASTGNLTIRVSLKLEEDEAWAPPIEAAIRRQSVRCGPVPS